MLRYRVSTGGTDLLAQILSKSFSLNIGLVILALPNTIAKHIAEQIVSGNLQPGDKLIELTYAQKYGTSRTPVREAIYCLILKVSRKNSEKRCDCKRILEKIDKRQLFDNLISEAKKKPSSGSILSWKK